MTFEAAFGPQGAVCVARVRIAENTSLDSLARSCPRLRQAVMGDACSEQAQGALLYVKSFPRSVGLAYPRPRP
jgi:hypothetical protein